MKAKYQSILRIAALTLAGLFLSGCATVKPYDYAAFKASRPASILVLPPLNSSPDVEATYSVMAQTTLPLAESGYYVYPVTLVDETFKQNGLTSPADIHAVSITKLREIFGADSALYLDVTQYGTKYMVISSETRVTVTAKLVDLRNGATLWSGSATASSAEGDSNNGGLVGMLIKAAIRQIVETISSQGHLMAGRASYRLLTAGQPMGNGILYGPRSPMYLKDGVPAH